MRDSVSAFPFGLLVNLLLLGLLTACAGGGADNRDNVDIDNNGGASSGGSSSSSGGAIGGTLEERLNTLLDDIDPNSAGVAVLVMKDGQVAYHAARGMADRTAGITLDERTGFRLASISKSFTALAIMQLVENGQLNVNASVLDYLPELSPSWQAITIKMMLCHRAGIYDLLNDRWQPGLINLMTNDGAVNYFASNAELEFTPDSREDYSNSGYVLLAEIIERVSGYTFGDYMRIHIFAPAGMEDSYINDERQPLRLGDARNYADRDTFMGITTYLSGNMAQVSSTRDFIHFFEALREGILVSPQALAAMQVRRSNLFGRGYGYGFMLGTTSFGHGGLWDGFRTEMTIDPESKIDYVILTNGGSRTQTFLDRIRSVINSH